MALETGTFIDSLVIQNPVATDPLAQADDHMRLIKSTIKSTFPSITNAVTATHTEINHLDGYTGTVADLNYAKDLNATGVTAAEFDYLDGVTSNIQTQIAGIQTELVNDSSPQLGGSLDTNGETIAFGSWTIAIDGSNNLTFSYGGDVKIRMTAAGALDVEDDITAFSGI
tara:strand:+ start:202 stop:711 length:510 start_codon:yes stop_codon:yes gene_type:complete